MKKINYILIIIGFTMILYLFAFTNYKYYEESYNIKEMVSKTRYDWYSKRYMGHNKNYGYTLIYYDKDSVEKKIWFEQDDWWADYDVKNLKLKMKYKYRIRLSLFEFPFEKKISLSDTEIFIYRPSKSSN